MIDGAGLVPYSDTELAGLRAVRWRQRGEDRAERLACQLRATGDAVVEKRGVTLLGTNDDPREGNDDDRPE